MPARRGRHGELLPRVQGRDPGHADSARRDRRLDRCIRRPHPGPAPPHAMTVPLDEPPLTLAGWRRRYAAPASTPRKLLSPVLAALREDDPAWILRCDDAFIEAQLARLEGADREALPLFGVPFAVKDNIDV